MKKQNRHTAARFRKRERQEVRKVLGKVKKQIASPEDFSNINHDFSWTYRLEYYRVTG